MLVILISIFLFARALISIGFITIIVMCFFDKGVLSKFRQNRSLQFLLVAAILVNIDMFYVAYVNQELYIKSFLAYSNPLLALLFICSASHFLSKNTKCADILLNVFIFVVAVFSIIAVVGFIYKSYLGQDFNVSQLYIWFNGGSAIQSIVALTFPFSAVYIIGKAINNRNTLHKIVMIIIGILIIFIDLFVNRSKAGYVIEFIVFIYYSFVILKYFSFENSKFKIRRFFAILCSSVLVLLMLFGIVYKGSIIFQDRVNHAIVESQLFFNSNYNESDAKLQNDTSTGLRLMYYYSSIQVFKAYPQILILGCPVITKDMNVTICTQKLINRDQTLSNDPRVVKDGIMAHDEFINYTFKGGILAGICLLMFFVMLLIEARRLDYKDRVFFRILIIAMFVGCAVDYFFTLQVVVILFISLLAIFLSKARQS
jgi:hypothetical protein